MAKFKELVAMEAGGEWGKAGMAIVGGGVFTLAVGGNQCFVKGVGPGAASRMREGGE